MSNSRIFGHDQERLRAALSKHLESTRYLDSRIDTLCELTGRRIDRTYAKLRRLGEASQTFPQPADDVEFSILEGISSVSDVDLLKDFCQKIDHCQSADRYLTEFFERSAELTPGDVDSLAEALAQTLEIVGGGLTLAQFDDLSNLCDATVMLIERVAQTTNRISETLGHDMPFNLEGVRAVQNAVSCVSDAPADLLELRDPQFENADFSKILGEAMRESGKIRELRSELGEIL